MDKIILYIDTRDRRYALRLAEYFSKYYASSMDVFLPGEEPDKEVTVLLTDEPDRVRGISAGKTLLLSEQDGIDPYQSAKDIAERILSSCRKTIKAPARPLGKDRQLSLLDDPGFGSGSLTAVYGLSGGIGTTTLCLSMAGIWQEAGFSILFVSLDTALPSYLSDMAGGTLGDLCYSLLAEETETFRKRLKELPGTVKGWSDQSHILPPPRMPDDLLAVTEEQLDVLLGSLREQYDITLFDLGSRLYRPHRQILDACDRVFVLEEATEEGRSRRQLLFEEEGLQEKETVFVTESLRIEKTGRYEKDRKRMLGPQEFWLPRVYELASKAGDIRRIDPASAYMETVRKAVLSH